jgi:hypothetical protein
MTDGETEVPQGDVQQPGSASQDQSDYGKPSTPQRSTITKADPS